VLVQDSQENVGMYTPAEVKVSEHDKYAGLTLSGDYLKSPSIRTGEFGSVVAQDGDYLAVCADDDIWRMTGILAGYEVHKPIEGDTAARDDSDQSLTGALHIFKKVGNQWYHE